MTNYNIEKLLEAIEERNETFRRRVELFGSDDILTLSAFSEVKGLEEAFRLVTGMTVVQYVLSRD